MKLDKVYATEKHRSSKTKRKAPEYPQSSRATVLPSPAPPRKGLWQKVKFEWRQKNSLEEFAGLPD